MDATSPAAAAGAGPDLADGLPAGPRMWAMSSVMAAVSLSVLDGGIVNVALPTIAAELHASPADTIWVANGFQLAVAVTILPFAALAEVVTYRRAFLFGLALFTLASLGCALAPTLPALIALRALQGIGSACLTGITPALVRTIYPRAMLGRGIGLVGVAVGLASALGPTLAAGILTLGPWPWLFLVNVPLGIIALPIASRVLPSIGGAARRIDLLSAALNAVAIGGLVVAVDGLGSVPALTLAATGALAILAAVWLWLRDRHRPSPLVPFDLLRVPVFALAAATSVCSYIALMIAFVAMPFYLHGMLHMDATQIGLVMTPWPLAIAVMGPVAGRLGDKYPAGILSSLGLGLMSAGLLALALLPAQPTVLDLVWRMVVAGIGFGFFQTPNNRAMVHAAPRARAGAAGGTLATARLVGMSLGAAVAAAAFALNPAHAEVWSLTVAAALAALGAAVSSLRLANAESASA